MTEQCETSLAQLGCRLGLNDSHAARAVMLGDLRTLSAHTSPQVTRTDCVAAVVDGDVFGEPFRLVAAEDLKHRLELILEGGLPYDIFVCWKPLAEQPIGWNPNLNDGVRLNISPCMTGDVLRHNKKPKLNVTWDKDRGKSVESALWLKKFKGDRINDLHLTLAERRAARVANGKGA